MIGVEPFSCNFSFTFIAFLHYNILTCIFIDSYQVAQLSMIGQNYVHIILAAVISIINSPIIIK